jgi:hypothetical protein
MRSLSRTAVFLPLVVPLLLPGGLLWFRGLAARADDEAGREEAALLEQPEWQVGDSWVVETLTQRVQGREDEPSGKSPRVRWEFRVTKIEKVAGNDCYRIEVECLARGRIRPQTTVWCDRKNLFLRQFQTQLAFNGRYRTVQESYACAKGETSPVVTFVNVLPIALPAFVPKGAKGGDTFAYTSRPLPAEAKDPEIIRFVHAMRQETQPAEAKLLSKALPAYAKNLDARPVVQVKLGDEQRSVVQLWQQGEPWPVYVEDGRTQAWLVSTERP